jgi:hypothetical protein
MKTSELTDSALDWAVAKCVDDGLADFTAAGWRFYPSTNWAQGGPIIEREKIDLTVVPASGDWMCTVLVGDDAFVIEVGPTPLIAAMRCYVASKLGDDVEVPDDIH